MVAAPPGRVGLDEQLPGGDLATARVPQACPGRVQGGGVADELAGAAEIADAVGLVGGDRCPPGPPGLLGADGRRRLRPRGQGGEVAGEPAPETISDANSEPVIVSSQDEAAAPAEPKSDES